ncbi:predicted protein [Sclerotinia sclerotiorum 1980 UF-70]|uniref:Uncharacterized protein n=1 Tax=Sclerotinia sclerotiorum (strain ATCC 18683 / 1980 / Ss-1) TaxID=665079 RepID=A7ESK4_SCLS1|nr:predicted protein [Sclerotinia sclerotiorum 1980 UF-70]EDN92446.1 predicted protein [Sclerotinia sclerotiorum 1980 UF-70]
MGWIMKRANVEDVNLVRQGKSEEQRVKPLLEIISRQHDRPVVMENWQGRRVPVVSDQRKNRVLESISLSVIH